MGVNTLKRVQYLKGGREWLDHQILQRMKFTAEGNLKQVRKGEILLNLRFYLLSLLGAQIFFISNKATTFLKLKIENSVLFILYYGGTFGIDTKLG